MKERDERNNKRKLTLDDLKAFKDSQFNRPEGNYFLTNHIDADIFINYRKPDATGYACSHYIKYAENFHNNLL